MGSNFRNLQKSILNMEILLIIVFIFIIGNFFEKSDYDRMKEAEKLPPFTKKEAQRYYTSGKIL